MPIAHSIRCRFAPFPRAVGATTVLLTLLVSVQMARAGDGDLDPSFGNGGRVMTDLAIYDIANAAIQTTANW
jgi:hypothetical protein